MPSSRGRNWKGRDRTEKRLRASLRKQGKLEGYLEMRHEAKKAALIAEVFDETSSSKEIHNES